MAAAESTLSLRHKLGFGLGHIQVSISLIFRYQWGTFYLFIANFFATLNIGGAIELVVLL